jgi:hypothetical protein
VYAEEKGGWIVQRAGPCGREWNGSTIHLFPSCNLLNIPNEISWPQETPLCRFQISKPWLWT